MTNVMQCEKTTHELLCRDPNNRRDSHNPQSLTEAILRKDTLSRKAIHGEILLALGIHLRRFLVSNIIGKGCRPSIQFASREAACISFKGENPKHYIISTYAKKLDLYFNTSTLQHIHIFSTTPFWHSKYPHSNTSIFKHTHIQTHPEANVCRFEPIQILTRLHCNTSTFQIQLRYNTDSSFQHMLFPIHLSSNTTFPAHPASIESKSRLFFHVNKKGLSSLQ